MARRKARKFNTEQRLAILKELDTLGSTATMKKYKLSSSVIHAWRKKFGSLPIKRREPRTPPSPPLKDAIIFLTHAKREIYKQVSQGGEIDTIALLALLALEALMRKGFRNPSSLN